MQTKEQIEQLFKSKANWLRSSDFNYNSAYYPILNKLIHEGKIVKVKRGLYQYVDHEQNQELEVVTNLYPQGIICLFSAWAHYELVDDIPKSIHLAFPHKSKPLLHPFPPIKAYFWSQKYYELGVDDNTEIRIYDIEKSVCDSIKFRNKIGIEITEQVIKSYMKLKNRNVNKLLKYASEMRVEEVIRPYLQVLL
jgi:predicted transcriptional regulator of viral defense system